VLGALVTFERFYPARRFPTLFRDFVREARPALLTAPAGSRASAFVPALVITRQAVGENGQPTEGGEALATEGISHELLSVRPTSQCCASRKIVDYPVVGSMPASAYALEYPERVLGVTHEEEEV
jgi:hypothetical protein